MLGARRHRTRLWLAAACGADPRVADLAARTVVAPREVPAGVLTALIGAPYLLGLLILERRAPGAQGDDARARRRARHAFRRSRRNRSPNTSTSSGSACRTTRTMRRAGLSYPSARCPITARQSSTRWSAITAAAAQHARALMSQWSKYYFGRAAPAGVVTALTLGRPLDMSPERTFVALDDGMPAALYFPHDALGAPCDFDQRPAMRGSSRISAR